MNEQLQQALASILGKTMQGVEAGVSFLSTEIPDVIHQLLVFKMAWSLVLFSAMGSCVLFLIIKGFRVAKKYNSDLDDSEKGIPYVIWSLGCGIPSFIMFIIAMSQLKTVMMIWLAPKIYLIEYAASLAK